jgi:hypothetical protein
VASEGNIEDVKFGVGSLVTVVGARSSYNGKPQMAAGCVLESFENFTAKTVAEFIAAEEGDFKVGDRVVVRYLENSKFVLEINRIEE